MDRRRAREVGRGDERVAAAHRRAPERDARAQSTELSLVARYLEVKVRRGGIGAADAQQVGLALFADLGAGGVRGGASGEFEKRVGSCAGFGVVYGPFRVDYAFNHAGRRKVHVTLVQD